MLEPGAPALILLSGNGRSLGLTTLITHVESAMAALLLLHHPQAVASAPATATVPPCKHSASHVCCLLLMASDGFARAQAGPLSLALIDRGMEPEGLWVVEP